MPSSLSDIDRDTIKRLIPKSANKILVAAVVRLYVAYPNKQRWTYTGLQGAAVLSNDLIGNTFWIKLVDISPANRGIIWDQEIYEPFYYNQDRTFFHSFELENCLAGFSFVSEKEAIRFKEKMDEREKKASKATRNTPFASTAGSGPPLAVQQEKSHSRFSNLLHGHRPSSTHNVPTQSIIPPRQPALPVQAPPTPALNENTISELDAVDPSWRGMLQELMKQGITEDQIAQNADFIKNYILEQQKAGSNVDDGADRPRSRPPPPPAAPPPGGHRPISPQNTGNTTASRRGPPPAPPAPRRGRVELPASTQQATPPRTPSPPRPKFKVPPPIDSAGKFAGSNAPAPPIRNRAPTQSLAPSGPPPPPRPPKTPENDEPESESRWAVPPAFTGERNTSTAPPARASVPAPPPRREISSSHAVPPPAAIPPPLPPKVPVSGAPASGPPPPPARKEVPNAVPAPPPRSAQAAPNGIPAPPPLPSSGAPPAPPPPPFPTSNAPPPPPPPPASGIPPPPPPPPAANGPPTAPAPASLPPAQAGRDDLMASIRSGGKGGLRKVKDSERNDRSAAAVPGSEAANPQTSSVASAAGGAGAGGLAGSLAAALAARKQKVSASDDEDDNDDW